MSARGVLAALFEKEIFEEETAYGDCIEAADLMIQRLAEQGLIIAPRRPSSRMMGAWRKEFYAGSGSPARAYAAAIEEAAKP